MTELIRKEKMGRNKVVGRAFVFRFKEIARVVPDEHSPKVSNDKTSRICQSIQPASAAVASARSRHGSRTVQDDVALSLPLERVFILAPKHITTGRIARLPQSLSPTLHRRPPCLPFLIYEASIGRLT